MGGGKYALKYYLHWEDCKYLICDSWNRMGQGTEVVPSVFNAG